METAIIAGASSILTGAIAAAVTYAATVRTAHTTMEAKFQDNYLKRLAHVERDNRLCERRYNRLCNTLIAQGIAIPNEPEEAEDDDDP